jgi:hypothetical protein
MKNPARNQVIQFKNIVYLVFILLLICGCISCASKGQFDKGNVTTDGMTVMKSTRFTEAQIKNGVNWSEYTKYLITPVEVDFVKNWKRDQNRNRGISGQVTEFLEIYDAVSGELLARWVDTREDPDRGYTEWATRITNESRAKHIVSNWSRRLVEGLDNLRAIN